MNRLRQAVFLLFFLPIPAGSMTTSGDLGGTLVTEIDGRVTHLPSLKTEYEAEIRGDLVAVTLTQRFVNPGMTPLNATYMFPLQEDAAVHAMRMETGTETVEAVIREKEQARQEFEKARTEGRNAALLTQHRPNVFTQEVANLMPGKPITIRLRYVQAIPRVDGAYELVMPLVVGPRYEKPPEPVQTVSAASPEETTPPPQVSGQWSFGRMPKHPPVTGLALPSSIDADRVAIKVRIDGGGIPVEAVESRTHGLVRQDDSTGPVVVTLAGGRTVDNKDFILRYRLAGAATQAGLHTHRDERGDFFSLMIEPPALPRENDIAPREMVFLLDCSGSMAGLPIEASKRFMVKALGALRPTDTFRIIRFSDGASEFSAFPLPATSDNIRSGMTYVQGLSGEGGTNMSEGIRQALAIPSRSDTRRIVTFLTDGYIGAESEVLNLVSRLIGPARLYAFGVGTGVNRFLLSEIGRIGGGFTRFMDPTENSEQVTDELVARLQSPVLTDISIDWGGLNVTEVMPDRIPDLFAGDSLRLVGRFTETKPGRIIVRGKVNGRPAELPLDVRFADAPAPGSEALPLVWARSRIAAHMTNLMIAASIRPGNESDDGIRTAVTRLGLDYSLATQWTSFVATAQTVVNQTGIAADRDVPLPQVSGVSPTAYPPEAFQGGTRQVRPISPYGGGGGGGGFGGGGAPEPSVAGGLAVVAAVGWLIRRRRRRLS